MPIDNGVNWEGKAGDNDAANVEVTAASTPRTGVIRVKIDANDEPIALAQRTEKEWNDRSPLDDVLAIASANSGLVRFIHPSGDILGLAVTFDGKTRKELGVGDQATSEDGSVVLRRVEVSFSPPPPSN